jgi:hypothetical protein
METEMTYLSIRSARSLLAATFIAAAPIGAQAGTYNLTVDNVKIDTGDFVRTASAITALRRDRSCGSRKAKR